MVILGTASTLAKSISESTGTNFAREFFWRMKYKIRLLDREGRRHRWYNKQTEVAVDWAISVEKPKTDEENDIWSEDHGSSNVVCDAL